MSSMLYRIAMRTGRDGKIVYAVQKGFKILGVKKWSNYKLCKDYDSARILLNQLTNENLHTDS